MLHTPLPYAWSSGIVTFHLEHVDSHVLYRHLLDQHRVLVSPVDDVEFGVDGVRVSTHVFNTESEAGRLLAGLPDAWSAR